MVFPIFDSYNGPLTTCELIKKKKKKKNHFLLVSDV